MSDASDNAWSRDLINRLNVGGTWTVPRSGLTFTKTGEKDMILSSRLPYHPELGGTDVEWIVYQDMDFGVIRDKFADIGVTVVERLTGEPGKFGVGQTASEKADEQ